jgi:CheY-like chemotaxis protein
MAVPILPEAGSSDRSSRFLLVVDSDANSLYYESMLLQRLQYHICSSKTAAEAREMAAVAVPVLIVTAQYLKDATCLELMQRLKEDPRLLRVPVVVLTQDGDLYGERQCLDAGAAACLTKPVQAESLFVAVQEAIEPTPRHNIRINTRLPVMVNEKPLNCGEGECASVLSEHGMYIRTLHPSAKNTLVPLRLDLRGRSVAALAEVLYSHAAGEGPFGEPGMALKFVQIASPDQELLRLFIREEITRGIKPL